MHKQVYAPAARAQQVWRTSEYLIRSDRTDLALDVLRSKVTRVKR